MKALIKVTLLYFLFLNNVAAQDQTSSVADAQKLLYGNVFNQDGETLIGATVVWEGTDIATVTDFNGDFWIPKLDTTALLEISYVGYDAVYIEMFPHEDTAFIEVAGITELVEVEIVGQGTDNFNSTLDPINLEHIGQGELQKAACCSLAESFETNGAIDVMQQSAITSAKEIQMLGLRGIYSQLLMEKRPVYTGLAQPLALDYIPGTWVRGIQISKGTSTVQNGPQAMTGQINAEILKPFEDKPVFVNLFGSTVERGEANIHLNKKWNKEWSSGVLLHGSTTQGEFDNNNDTFQDQATKETLNGLFRTFYRGENVRSQINVQILKDEHNSGQLLPEGDFNPNEFYRIRQYNRLVDVFGKIGFLGFTKPGTSMGFIYNASWHKTDNTFGNTYYRGTQQHLYANLMYQTILGTTDHKFNAGINYQLNDYSEFLDEADFSRKEIMPGAYAEYVFSGVEGLGLIAGLRVDHHNQFGTFITPRLNLKYNFNENQVVRLSAGRGVRSAQFLAENLGMLAANHEYVILENFEMEDAWNIGMNYTQNFPLLGRKAGVVFDLYRTEFNNQIVADRESEHGNILFYNLEGRSYSNSLLLLTTYEAFDGFNIKLAYKLNDVKTTFSPPTFFVGGDLQQRPMTTKHRGLAALDYKTKDDNWMINTNIQFVGAMLFGNQKHRLPSTANVDEFIGSSPSYTLVNAQITRRFKDKNFEIYVGGENLTNFTQEHAIVDFENPFGEYFDAMQVWGPLIGTRGYIGVRWWIE